MPALTELAEPGEKIRIADKLHLEPGQRALDLVGLMSGHHGHAGYFGGQHVLGYDPQHRLAAEFGQQLVGTAHPGRAPGRKNDRGDIAIAFRAWLARLRPGHDLHQQSADAHAGEIRARHLEAREQAHQHPVKPVLHRRARAAGRAQHRHASGIADQQQIAGIDRHAEMLDLAADLFERRRNHVAPVGDRGCSEHDHQFGAEPEQFLDRRGKRRLLVRHAAFGDDR